MLVNLSFCFCRQHQGALQTGRWWGSRVISEREELFQRRPLRRGRIILWGPCCLDSSYLLLLDHVRLILFIIYIICATILFLSFVYSTALFQIIRTATGGGMAWCDDLVFGCCYRFMLSSISFTMNTKEFWQ